MAPHTSPTDTLIAIVERAHTRTVMDRDDEQIRRTGLAFADVLARVADDCGVDLLTLQAACAVVVGASLARFGTHADVDDFCANHRVTVDAIRTYCAHRVVNDTGAAVH